jgi:hypothetical protein
MFKTRKKIAEKFRRSKVRIILQIIKQSDANAVVSEELLKALNH